jgi:hypothetical protein
MGMGAASRICFCVEAVQTRPFCPVVCVRLRLRLCLHLRLRLRVCVCGHVCVALFNVQWRLKMMFNRQIKKLMTRYGGFMDNEAELSLLTMA